MHPIYTFDKSMAMLRRAMNTIPGGIYGHQGPVEGCHIPVDAYPKFCQRAQGTYFWDVDGNRFIDYMCAYGPNILGYNDPEVDEAAARQRALCDCVTAPSSVMVDFAELLVDTVASADWAFFAKNGNDVTSLSVMAARAYTRRKKIVFFRGYYHGVSPWTQKLDYPGILPEEEPLNDALCGALSGALRPEYELGEAAEDLRMLAKQGVSLREMENVMASMLAVLPTQAMKDALKRLYLCTPHWMGLRAALAH